MNSESTQTAQTNQISQPSAQTTEKNIPAICSVCHQTLLPQYYFCPNCGNKIHTAPLSTSVLTQIGIYIFSIILPSLCFLFISKWPGLKYSRSSDKKTRTIGIIAWILLILSTVITFWYAYVWTQNIAKSITDSLSADLSVFSI